MPVIELTTYRPATYRGRVLRLHYARAEELEPWLDLVAAQGEVHVQFWLKPGDPPGGVGAGGGGATMGEISFRDTRAVPREC